MSTSTEYSAACNMCLSAAQLASLLGVHQNTVAHALRDGILLRDEDGFPLQKSVLAYINSRGGRGTKDRGGKARKLALDCKLRERQVEAMGLKNERILSEHKHEWYCELKEAIARDIINLRKALRAGSGTAQAFDDLLAAIRASVPAVVKVEDVPVAAEDEPWEDEEDADHAE